MIAELADGRTLEFPDGTDPAVVQATVKRLLNAPSDTSVAVNAANKGLAGIPDAVLNAPQNVINLGKAAYGTATALAGRPDLSPDITPAPDLVRGAMTSAGLIKPENDPTNARQRIIDTLMQGGAGMLAAPAKSIGQVAKNVLTGEIGGGAAGVTKEATGSEPLAIAASIAAPMGPSMAARAVVGRPRPMNEVETQTLDESRAKGYKVPGSETNELNWVNNRLESIAGKDAVKQQMTVDNQRTTNRLGAEELGYPSNKALTPAVLDEYREKVSGPYREVAGLSDAAAKNLEKLKDARANRQLYQNHFERQADPESLRKARAYGAQADMLEQELDRVATRRGRPELLDELRAARRQIAKSYEIQGNLNLGNADISAPGAGRDLSSVTSGNLKTIGAFAQAYPRYAAEGAKAPPPGVSKGEMVSAALLGTMGFGATGGKPAGLAAGLIPFASSPARALVTSDAYQRLLQGSGKPMTEQQIQALMLARAIAERNQ